MEDLYSCPICSQGEPLHPEDFSPPPHVSLKVARLLRYYYGHTMYQAFLELLINAPAVVTQSPDVFKGYQPSCFATFLPLTNRLLVDFALARGLHKKAAA